MQIHKTLISCPDENTIDRYNVNIMQFLSFPVQTSIRGKHNTFRIPTLFYQNIKIENEMPSGQQIHHFDGIVERLALPMETHPSQTNSAPYSNNPVIPLAGDLKDSTDTASKLRTPENSVLEQDRASRRCTGTIPITEQGYHNLMSLQSLGFWSRHKLVIFGNKLSVFQNLIRSVIDSNNIIVSRL